MTPVNRKSQRRIVVGCDGQAESADAIALADLMGTALDAELVVAAAWKGRRDELEGDKRLFFERCFSLAEKVLGGKPFRRRELSSSPVRGLKHLAASEAAAMIVVGSTNRGLLGRAIPGSTAEQLIHDADFPVLLAPIGFAERGSIANIGVAFDGLRESERALEYGWRLADQMGVRLEVFAVGPRYSALDQALTQDREINERKLRERVDAALSMVPSGVPCHGQTLTGDPGKELVKAFHDLDIVIAGSKGKGAIRSLAMGSVSGELIRSAHCAVLVVPKDCDLCLTFEVDT